MSWLYKLFGSAQSTTATKTAAPAPMAVKKIDCEEWDIEVTARGALSNMRIRAKPLSVARLVGAAVMTVEQHALVACAMGLASWPTKSASVIPSARAISNKAQEILGVASGVALARRLCMTETGC